MEQRQPIPWVLALGVFPVLGAVGWIVWGSLTPSSPDSAFNGLLNAVPYLLAFLAPPVATVLVAAHRKRPVAGVLLAAVTPVVTIGVLALVIACLYIVGCSGSGPCST